MLTCSLTNGQQLPLKSFTLASGTGDFLKIAMTNCEPALPSNGILKATISHDNQSFGPVQVATLVPLEQFDIPSAVKNLKEWEYPYWKDICNQPSLLEWPGKH